MPSVTCSVCNLQLHSAVPFGLFLVTKSYVLDLLQEACFPFVAGGSENQSFLLSFLLWYIFNMIRLRRTVALALQET